MSLGREIKEVINNMLSADQVLRQTSPQHLMNAEEQKKFLDAISKAEDSLRKIRGMAGMQR